MIKNENNSGHITVKGFGFRQFGKCLDMGHVNTFYKILNEGES
jgi:hypothetical protein